MPPPNSGKYFSGNCHVKFGHFVDFSYIIFGQKCLAHMGVVLVKCLGGGVKGGTAGPERAAEPRGWCLSQHGPVWGPWAMPPENFSKINVKIAYLSAFLLAQIIKWSLLQSVASRHDRQWEIQNVHTSVTYPPH